MAVAKVWCLIVASVVLVCSLLSIAEAGLTLNKKCGEKTCGELEFCSPFDNICRPCESVCELGSHNYQEEMCQKDCQDYLHDRQYLKRDVMGRLQEDIQTVYMLVTVVLVICVIILIIVVGVLTYFVLRAKKQNSALAEKIRKKMSTINALQGNNNVSNKDTEAATAADVIPRSVAYKIDAGGLRLDMGTASAGTATSTPNNGRPPRYPAEDATLEYGGYDNPGLHVTPSPVFDKDCMMSSTKRESSF